MSSGINNVLSIVPALMLAYMSQNTNMLFSKKKNNPKALNNS